MVTVTVMGTVLEMGTATVTGLELAMWNGLAVSGAV